MLLITVILHYHLSQSESYSLIVGEGLTDVVEGMAVFGVVLLCLHSFYQFLGGRHRPPAVPLLICGTAIGTAG